MKINLLEIFFETITELVDSTIKMNLSKRVFASILIIHYLQSSGYFISMKQPKPVNDDKIQTILRINESSTITYLLYYKSDDILTLVVFGLFQIGIYLFFTYIILITFLKQFYLKWYLYQKQKLESLNYFLQTYLTFYRYVFFIPTVEISLGIITCTQSSFLHSNRTNPNCDNIIQLQILGLVSILQAIFLNIIIIYFFRCYTFSEENLLHKKYSILSVCTTGVLVTMMFNYYSQDNMFKLQEILNGVYQILNLVELLYYIPFRDEFIANTYAVLCAFSISFSLLITIWTNTDTLIDDKQIFYSGLLVTSILSYTFISYNKRRFYQVLKYTPSDIKNNPMLLDLYLEKIHALSIVSAKDDLSKYQLIETLLYHKKFCSENECLCKQQKFITSNNEIDLQFIIQFIYKQFEIYLSYQYSLHHQKVLEHLQLKFITFIANYFQNPVRAYYQLKISKKSLKIQSLFFKLVSNNIETKIGVLMKLKNKKLVTQDKQDNQQLQLNLIIETIQQKDEFIPQIKNYLTEKINFWKTTLKGYKKLDDFASQVIELALKGEQLKQQIATFYTLPQNQSLLEDNFLFLKIQSIFFCLVTNEQRKCFKIEQQLQEMLNRYGGISHLISIINVNSDIIKNTVCYLTISIVQDRGRIINKLTPKMANFFSYQFQEFSTIKYVHELMPEQISVVHNRFIDNYLDRGTSILVDSFSTVAIRVSTGFIQQVRIYVQAPQPSLNDFFINGSIQKLDDDQQKLVIINSIGQIVGVTESLFKSLFCYNFNQIKTSKNAQETVELFELKQLMGINFFFFFPQLIKQIISEIASTCQDNNNNINIINNYDNNKQIQQEQQQKKIDLNQIISNQTGIVSIPSQIFEIQKNAEKQINKLSQINQYNNSFSSQLEVLNQLNTFISQCKEYWEQDEYVIQSEITFSVSKKKLSIVQNNVHQFENLYFILINQENIIQAPLNVITQKKTQIIKNISVKLNEKMNKIYQDDDSFRDNISSPIIKIFRQNSSSMQNYSPEFNFLVNSTSNGLKNIKLNTSYQDKVNENQYEISEDSINSSSCNNKNNNNNILHQIKILDKNFTQENGQSQIMSPSVAKQQNNSIIEIISPKNQPNAQNQIYSNQSNALLQILSPGSQQEQTHNFIFNENNSNFTQSNKNRLLLFNSNSNRLSSVNHFENQFETHMNMQRDKEVINASNNKNIEDFFQSNKKILEEEINCGQSSTQDMQSIKHSVHNIVSQIINRQDIKISKIINSLLYIILIVFSFYSLIYGLIMFDTLKRVNQSIIDVTTYQNLNNVYANQTLNSVLLYQFKNGILVPNSPINYNLKYNSFEYIYYSCSNNTDLFASDKDQFSSILYSDFQDRIKLTLYPNKIPFQIEANYVETIFYNQINVIDLCLNSTFNYGEIEQESVLYLASNYFNNQIQVQNYTQKLVKNIKTQYDLFDKLYLMFAIIVAGTFFTMFVLFIHYFKQINKYKSKVLLLLARTNIDEAAFEIQKLNECLKLLDDQLEAWVQNSFFSILSKASSKQYDSQKIQTTQSKRQSDQQQKSVKSLGQYSEKLSRKSKFQIKNIFSKLSKKLNINNLAKFLNFKKQAQNTKNSAINKLGGQKYVSALIQNHSLSIIRQVLIILFFCVSGSIFFIIIVTTNYLKTKEIEPLYHLFDQSIQNTQSLCSVITLGYLLVTNKINQLNNTSYPNIISNSTINYFNSQINLVQMSINQFSTTIAGTSFSSQSQSYCNQILDIFEQDLCNMKPLSISCQDLNSPFRKVIQNGLSGIITSYSQLYFQNIYLDINQQNLVNSLSKEDVIKQQNYFIANPSFINLIFYGYDIPLYYTMKISLLISEAVTNQATYIRNLIFIYFFSVGIVLGLIWLLFSVKVRNKFNDELKSINFSLTLLPYQKCQEEATIFILKSIQKI
ncbi:hypothetical protein ABPG72_012325 [Tetrahymena utriculariae]